MTETGGKRTPTPDTQELIRKRAEEIYERNGKIAGRDLENWVQAETEVRRELSQQTGKAAIVVNVHGVRYVGEYLAADADGYVPGEFAQGDPVPVRIEGDRMFVLRGNGKELVTKIVSASASQSA